MNRILKRFVSFAIKTLHENTLLHAFAFIAILLGFSMTSCNEEMEENYGPNGSIRLTSAITPTSRIVDQSLQSKQIVKGQQVGITITGAKSEHENVAWKVDNNGTLVNDGPPIYWSTSEATITAYHPYQATWTDTSHTFTVNTDQSTEEGYINSDLLWANATAYPTDNPVALSFSHKLAKINITLINDGYSDMSNATITICGTNIAVGFNLQNGELFEVTENIADIKASVTTPDAYTASAIIVPQTMKQGSKFIKISLGEEEFYHTLQKDQIFESGQAYHYTLKVKLNGGNDVKTDYVDLKFDMPGVTTEYNELNGSLTITYPNNNIPNAREGYATVLPAKYNFDIRVIEHVSQSGNTLNLITSQGNMANLFRNISFTLTTDPSVASRSASGEHVYTPTAYGYIDENGKYHEIYNENQDTRAVYVYEKEFLNLDTNYNGDIIYEGKAGKLSWDKCELFSSLKGTLTFDFGEKKISEVRSIGDLKKFDCTLNGNLDIDLLLHYNYNYENTINDDCIFKYNIIPTRLLTFAVGEVPVVILVYTHLGKQYHCQIEGQIDATAGLKFRNEMSIGMKWNPNEGVTPIKNINPTYEFYPLTVKAQASVNGKVSYYPQIEVGIYKFLGPWFEPRPYIKENIEAGAYASTDGNNHIGWKAETYTGMDIRMGLKMDFGLFDKPIWTSPIHNWIDDYLLFKAPSHIRTLSPGNNITVNKGENVVVEYIVESFSPITNQYYPCPGALVNFEPQNGEVENKWAITDSKGKVMVKWTPIAEQSQPTEINDYTLIAKILDKEGEIIDESKFIVKTAIQDEDMSDYEAVDLGLSVKWASHNVGATKPEEYGGYYAWGEMDEKDEYSPFTYKFFSDLDNDDYWDEEEYEYLGSNISGTKYDIAHKKWGNGWRMPTLKEAKELINQCTWEEKVMNGIIGRLVTGPNGNSIFLPGSGYIVGPTEIFHKYNDHDGASYWCSEIHYIDTHAAYTFSFEDYEGNKGYTKVWMRDYGCPIRPVKNK